MELNIEQALQQGVMAHKEGKLQDAETFYRSILKTQPKHSLANHCMGVLAVSINETQKALPLFKTAVEINPEIEQFWLSYVDALIRDGDYEKAKCVIEQGRGQGLAEDKISALFARIRLVKSSDAPNQKEELQLSAKGIELVNLYEDMVANGYKCKDGTIVTNTYNDFELKKFREICHKEISKDEIKTVLDYGGGGSDWDAPDFEPTTGETAKQFFNLNDVCTFEPARNLMEKKKSDCVVCMDVLEHIFVSDVPRVVDELFSLSRKLLVINVACYKAAALLPNGENAHVTVRSPTWWKGMVDSISINHEDIEVMLMCSQTFSSGIIFETFKSLDWLNSGSFETETEYFTFKQD
jgi:hypothetical protein